MDLQVSPALAVELLQSLIIFPWNIFHINFHYTIYGNNDTVKNGKSPVALDAKENRREKLNAREKINSIFFRSTKKRHGIDLNTKMDFAAIRVELYIT